MTPYATSASKRAKRGLDRVLDGRTRPYTPPYRASWADNLIDWIKHLPIPPWLFYGALSAVLVVIIVAGSWIDGSAPIGQIAMPTVYLIAPLYSVWLLAAMHYLDNTAHHAFNAFRSALGVSPDESRGLQYELTTLPAPQAIWVAAIGAAFGLLVLILGNIELRFRNAPIVLSAVAPLSMLGFIVAAELLYHTVHQLRLVSRIHRVAAAIDPFDFTPLYAFSRLSAQTGLIFLLLMYIDFVVNPETFANAALLALNALGLPFIAAACFILPLAGMHRRLVHEKRRLEWEVTQRIETSMKHLYRRVDLVDLQDADALNKTMGSLIMARDVIAKIPTWPWQPGTFTLFFTAVTLPVVVFLIQMFLKSAFGFK